MTKTNPFRTTTKVLKFIGKVFIGLAIAAYLIVPHIFLWPDYGFWSLLLYPSVVLFLAAFFMIGFGIDEVAKGIKGGWRNASRKWDQEHGKKGI